MSKSILVIDTPKRCAECRLCAFGNYGSKRCTGKDQPIFLNGKKQKPDWCPLRDLPEKIAEENRWLSKEYAKGYNACIGEILKGDGVE